MKSVARPTGFIDTGEIDTPPWSKNREKHIDTQTQGDRDRDRERERGRASEGPEERKSEPGSYRIDGYVTVPDGNVHQVTVRTIVGGTVSM